MNRIPHNLTLGKITAGFSRLYFLSVPPGLRENTILYVDFDSLASNSTVLEWQQFLDSFQPVSSSGLGQMSREEQLLRERKRLRSYGITSYDYQCVDQVSHFAFSAANSIFVCSDHSDGILKPVSSTLLLCLFCAHRAVDNFVERCMTFKRPRIPLTLICNRYFTIKPRIYKSMS